MEKKKLSKKQIIVILLFITFFVPVTYATYRRVVLGNASLGLARWSVSLNQSAVNEYLSVIPDPNGVAASYTVNITSVSDVNVVYSIVIDNLPTGVSVALDNGTYVQENNHEVVFNNVSTILYNAQNKSKSHTLSFKASSSTQYVTNTEVDIDVIVKQQL